MKIKNQILELKNSLKNIQPQFLKFIRKITEKGPKTPKNGVLGTFSLKLRLLRIYLRLKLRLLRIIFLAKAKKSLFFKNILSLKIKKVKNI